MTDRRYCVHCVHFQPAPAPQSGDHAIRFGRCNDERAQKFPHIQLGTESNEFLSPELERKRMPYASILRDMPAACSPAGAWYQDKPAALDVKTAIENGDSR